SRPTTTAPHSTRAMEHFRYLILAEGAFGRLTSKTANSAIRYLGPRIVGVLDSTQAGRTAQDVLGFGGTLPVVEDIQAGLALQPTALLIGIAPTGGRLPLNWRPTILAAIDAGLPIVSGLHFHLSEDEELASFARVRGVEIFDLRKP